MKRILFSVSLLIPHLVLASEPVTLSGPVPALLSSYLGGTSNIVVYTLSNYAPKVLPVTVGGISNGITRTSVSGDCGDVMPAGSPTNPSTCNIGINISPSSSQSGSTISQTLTIDYQGRAPLSSSISFIVQNFAYVTPLSPDAANPSQIQQYLIAQDGSLSFEQNATQTSGHYGQMTFATANGTQYAYILENGVTYCSIDSTGAFDSCTSTTAPIGAFPHGIAFATFNQQYAYLADQINVSLFQCSLELSNGNLSSCSEYDTDGYISAPLGIAINTDTNSVQHAYVSDAASGMLICPLDQTTGSFVNPPGCVPTPSAGVPPWLPYGITFNTAGGTRYAYVADNGAGANLGHVYRCLLNVDGTFKDNDCVATPPNTASYAPWNPSYIAFNTLNGVQYAYVVNNQNVNIGSIYRCSVDETTGLLNQDCIQTPVIPTSRDTWQPSGIAFR